MTTNAVKKGLTGTLYGRVPYTAPATLYFGISTSDIATDGSGIVEPSPTTGYARVALVNSVSATWDISDDGVATNKIEIRMNELNTDCGKATHYFLSDVAVDGNALIWEKLKVADYRPLPAFSTLYINIGDVKFGTVDVANP